ncbi:proteasome subunit beta type-3-A-like [Hibiscus syriacus]|uniref:Proteasome subunit beta type-3-A-like n=1 Tax=Hibiscus syriacus TaxID=106335 RepID=A0A6A3C503_HIBSY|nr:E3 ubiquitin ligase BIG BROTHER-related-like [Hibiscus syriacus]KAE8724270.1 proteasome subunit beta type-3-A-like [Hibiscus syriacus]
MENEDTKQSSKRVPFTELEQIDSNLAMAMALQEQERASPMIESDDREECDTEASYEESNVNDYEYFEGLEAGDDLEFEDMEEDDDFEEEDEDNEIDLDDLSYEELISLGEFIGVEKRGLSPDEILPCLIRCKFRSVECRTELDRCVVCQTEYEEDEDVVALRNCEHPYHSDCISKWLQVKKICPICSTEISSPKN